MNRKPCQRYRASLTKRSPNINLFSERFGQNRNLDKKSTTNHETPINGWRYGTFMGKCMHRDMHRDVQRYGHTCKDMQRCVKIGKEV